MKTPVPAVPHCLGCNRPADDTPGMLSLRQGGMPTHLCFDCIGELYATAALIRSGFMVARPRTGAPHA